MYGSEAKRSEMSQSRQGRKRLIDVFDEASNGKRLKVGKPLAGVVACLSGLSLDKKTRLHALIESLGGR
jgi:hypothetical protein